MKAEKPDATFREKKEGLEIRLRRIESDIAKPKEKVGISG